MAQPLSAPYSYFADSNGVPLAGGKIYTYIAGTTTPQNSYTDSTGVTPAANPVILDSAGRATIWLSGTYKIVVKDSLDNTIVTTDNISALSNSGDMTKAVYDAANIMEQLVGLTAVQTLTNKTLTNPTITSQTPPTPQGRLTLVTGVPVMISDQTAKTTIYYTPYIGDVLPIYDAANFVNRAFTELTLTLDTTKHPTTKVYDVYASLQSGTIALSAMYWGSNTSRSTSAAGFTGTGNASVTQKNGLWVNNAAIGSGDSFNNTTGYAIAQYQGTYLGTFYTTANGQTGVALLPSAATGGSNNIVGLWNAYNRVKTYAICKDSTVSWTYTSGTVRAANASNSNRVSYVDGLQSSPVDASYSCNISNAGGVNGQIAIGFNSTTASTGLIAAQTSSSQQTIAASASSYPLLGLNYIQALEFTTGATTTYTANSSYQALMVGLNI